MQIVDERYAYREAFLNVVERERANHYRAGGELTESELARRAFPGASDPVRRWRKIRKEGSALPVEEAHMLALALGSTLSYLSHLASEEMRKSQIPVSNVIKMAQGK